MGDVGLRVVPPMTALKKRRASPMAFLAALSMIVLVPPALSQETQPAGAARQIIMQHQTGGRLVSRRAAGASLAVTARAQSASRDPAVAGQLERRWLFELPAGTPRTTAGVEDEEERGTAAPMPSLARRSLRRLSRRSWHPAESATSLSMLPHHRCCSALCSGSAPMIRLS